MEAEKLRRKRRTTTLRPHHHQIAPVRVVMAMVAARLVAAVVVAEVAVAEEQTMGATECVVTGQKKHRRSSCLRCPPQLASYPNGVVLCEAR